MDGDGHMIELERLLFGCPICCRATRLDSGIHVLLTGGGRSHIGAVSVAEPDGKTETNVFPGHKDQFVSEPWAKALAAKIGQRACVVCGIHYSDPRNRLRRFFVRQIKCWNSCCERYYKQDSPPRHCGGLSCFTTVLPFNGVFKGVPGSVRQNKMPSDSGIGLTGIGTAILIGIAIKRDSRYCAGQTVFRGSVVLAGRSPGIDPFSGCIPGYRPHITPMSGCLAAVQREQWRASP